MADCTHLNRFYKNLHHSCNIPVSCVSDIHGIVTRYSLGSCWIFNSLDVHWFIGYALETHVYIHCSQCVRQTSEKRGIRDSGF